MKPNFFKVLPFTFIIFSMTLFSCTEEKKDETKQEITEIKTEFKEVGSSIGDLFKQEQGNFKESANELLGDLDNKIDGIKIKIKNGNNDPALAEQLNELESKVDNLEKQLKELDNATEEQLAESKQNLKKGFEDLKKEMDAITIKVE